MAIDERADSFATALGADVVDLARLRELAFDGVPEGRRMRARAWKLLLGYLPPERSAWARTEASQRRLYHGWKAELIVRPSDGHPLTSATDSSWGAYFQNEELFREIEKDVSRTLPDYGFFAAETPGGDARRVALLHILFVYAKLNPGIRYVQGMNELLAPIFYLLVTEAAGAGGPSLGHLEADAFFCFTNLMAETRDAFCQPLDSSSTGVRGSIEALRRLLATADPELHAHLAREKVSAQFFAFRWLTLLLSQEFDLPDVLRIWDSFFADAGRFRFVLFWCLAMLQHARELLLASDFAGIVKALQRYPDPDVPAIHRLAARLYAQERAGTLGRAAPPTRAADAPAAPPQPPQSMGEFVAAAAAAVRRTAEDVLAGASGAEPRRRSGPDGGAEG